MLRIFGLSEIKGDDAAVILFTSGSEAAPKGVPLSHRNILVNIETAMEIVEFVNKDVFLGFLPPFHSFGLTVCSILPVVTGARAVFHPNPN